MKLGGLFCWMTLLACAGLTGLALAQEPGADQVRTRKLWDDTFLKQREEASKAPAPAPVKAGPGKSAPAAKTDLKAGPQQSSMVGVTLWRLRPSKPSDPTSVRALVHEDSGRNLEYTPERVTSDTPLAVGERVRISVESAQPGFLYIIDREEYADGSKGAPMLIFPTTRTRGGDNRVSAGKPVEVPASNDDPSYFKMTRDRPNQTSETLLMLITPEKIPGVSIGAKEQPLTAEQVSSWEKAAAASAVKLEAKDQAGKAYTPAEREAAIGTRALRHEDPVAQTMFQIDSKPGDMILVRFPLNIAR